jgi:hypothetical protein
MSDKYVTLEEGRADAAIEMQDVTAASEQRVQQREELMLSMAERKGPGLGSTLAFVGLGWFLLFFAFGVILVTTNRTTIFVTFSATSTSATVATLDFLVAIDGLKRTMTVRTPTPAVITGPAPIFFPAYSFPTDLLPAAIPSFFESVVLPLNWYVGGPQYASIGQTANLGILPDGTMYIVPLTIDSPQPSNPFPLFASSFDAVYNTASVFFVGKDLVYSAAP